MRLEARNFEVILIVIPFLNVRKDKLYRINGSQLNEWNFGLRKVSGLSRIKPQVITLTTTVKKEVKSNKIIFKIVAKEKK